MNITTQTGTSRPALLSLAGGLSFFIVFIFGTLAWRSVGTDTDNGGVV